MVWVTWATTSIVAAWWVIAHGRAIPYADEWHLVGAITGAEPMTLDWVLQQFDAHRLISLKLIMVPLTRLAGGDFRATPAFTLAVLCLTAAAAIHTFRKIRGRTRLVDTFFPIVLLSLGVDALYYGFQMQFATAGAAAVCVLLVMVRYRLDVPPGPAWLAIGLMLFLLGQGGPGLALLPPLGIWLAIAGLRLRRTRKLQGTLVLGGLALGVLATGAYFIGFSSSNPRKATSFGQFLEAIGRVSGSAAGDRMSDMWPWGGIVAVAVLLATSGVAVWLLRKGEDRQRAIVLALFGFGAITLILVIAYGRGGMTWSRGLEHHYMPLVLPATVWIFAVWDEARGRIRAWATGVFTAFMILVYVWGITETQPLGAWLAQESVRFRTDMCAGMPADQLTAKYLNFLYYTDDEYGRKLVATGITEMREHKSGDFAC